MFILYLEKTNQKQNNLTLVWENIKEPNLYVAFTYLMVLDMDLKYFSDQEKEKNQITTTTLLCVSWSSNVLEYIAF